MYCSFGQILNLFTGLDLVLCSVCSFTRPVER